MSSDPRIGTGIGEYRIERLLGRGGMSVVYLAEHVRLKRKAALKLLSPELAEDPTFRARFVSEWERLAQLDHPNIIPVFEAGETDGLMYIAMRYVKTTDLKGLIEQEGPLDPERAMRIVSQTASALDAAHAQDLVHRDVKPANILVAAGAGPEGTDHVYLSDFGLTKHTQSQSGLTQTGHFMGTIDYVAPEQISGKGVDGRTDQYALACVLFQCLTGRVPFPREEETAALFAHLQDPPPRVTELRPELPPEIDDPILRAMSKEKEERFDSCTEFARTARRALNVIGSTVASTPVAVVAETRLAAPPAAPTPVAAGSALPSAPPIGPAPAPVVRPGPPGRGPEPPAGKRRWLPAVAAASLVVAIGVFAVTQLGGGGGTEAETGGGPGGDGLPVLLSDDFEDPGTGWESQSVDGVTQGYVEGAYRITFDETAAPDAFAVADDGAGSVSSGDVRVLVEAEVLGKSQSLRDGFGVSCRVGSSGAYYFIVSTAGGWSIQKLESGREKPTILLTSNDEPVAVPIRDVNEIQADCSGPEDGPVTLTLTVNGIQVPSAIDDADVLPPGRAGLAVAGPVVANPAGLSVAFDNLVIEDLSGSTGPSA
jgi:serine/threonine-protein kinase